MSEPTKTLSARDYLPPRGVLKKKKTTRSKSRKDRASYPSLDSLAEAVQHNVAGVSSKLKGKARSLYTVKRIGGWIDAALTRAEFEPSDPQWRNKASRLSVLRAGVEAEMRAQENGTTLAAELRRAVLDPDDQMSAQTRRSLVELVGVERALEELGTEKEDPDMADIASLCAVRKAGERKAIADEIARREDPANIPDELNLDLASLDFSAAPKRGVTERQIEDYLEDTRTAAEEASFNAYAEKDPRDPRTGYINPYDPRFGGYGDPKLEINGKPFDFDKQDRERKSTSRWVEQDDGSSKTYERLDYGAPVLEIDVT